MKPIDYATTALKVCVGLALLAVPPVSAGSPFAELEYRLPCEARGSRVEIRNSERFNAAVGLEYDRGRPVLLVNERLAVEQPFEVVAFEYLSACVMAQRLDEPTYRQLSNERRFADILRESDCEALSRLDYAGIVRGSASYQTILEYYRFWRASEEYLGVPFAVRADMLARSCPR